MNRHHKVRADAFQVELSLAVNGPRFTVNPGRRTDPASYNKARPSFALSRPWRPSNLLAQ